MRAPLIIAVVAVLAGTGITGSSRAENPAPSPNALHADPGRPDISGLWMTTGYFTFDPAGTLPELKPPFDRLYEQRVRAFKAGAPIDDVTADCLPPGMPHIQSCPIR
jgi:hypothetical protein